jgi:hypothetical protein
MEWVLHVDAQNIVYEIVFAVLCEILQGVPICHVSPVQPTVFFCDIGSYADLKRIYILQNRWISIEDFGGRAVVGWERTQVDDLADAHLATRLLFKVFHENIQIIRENHIVIVQKYDEIARRPLNSELSRSVCPVFGIVSQTDEFSLIRTVGVSHFLRDVAVKCRVVHDNEVSPIRVRLSIYTVQASF